jgi:ribosomal protein L40E
MGNLNNSGGWGEQATEIYVKKILAGNVENVRFQLVAVIESLGYDIIEDEPNIIARRGARGWATWYGSADVLDYAMTLTVRLKPIGENSTRATFDYSVKNPMLNKGEKEILVQEAKTIAALSKKQALEKICSLCETESTDESKFCRKCGAPLASERAEREVLRMMGEVRAGKTSVVSAAVLMLVSFVSIVAAFLINNLDLANPKAYRFPLFFGLLSLALAVMSSFFAWNRLKRTLTQAPEKPEQNFQTYASPSSGKTGELYELPPQRPASITEGTTNLLDEEWLQRNEKEKEKVPVSYRRNTNNLD